MTSLQMFATIALLTVGTVATRSIPFLLFPAHRETPTYIRYLGRVLPRAVIGLLVVYCLKGIAPLEYPYGMPELIAIAVIVALHFWKRNSLLSIGAGTIVYMILVQQVFL
ncbi:MAG: branched-chain amino acid transporter AzlD [Firmicutes bacterium HGW-Firmicutes-11]|jgi:branched-subunit amino acid transport protein AzlD|nr:MAG: branched-chain amino acid transporter AzlD [Firmicutes bacterium HGW-Firmicutes-11]